MLRRELLQRILTALPFVKAVQPVTDKTRCLILTIQPQMGTDCIVDKDAIRKAMDDAKLQDMKFIVLCGLDVTAIEE